LRLQRRPAVPVWRGGCPEGDTGAGTRARVPAGGGSAGRPALLARVRAHPGAARDDGGLPGRAVSLKRHGLGDRGRPALPGAHGPLPGVSPGDRTVLRKGGRNGVEPDTPRLAPLGFGSFARALGRTPAGAARAPPWGAPGRAGLRPRRVHDYLLLLR